ncbi:MAG TPA: glycosyltransferase family 9 protein [Verrucomicrobiae bacterium]|nr:glycosyltransferase family 9 protein [Verrucomicrobiae bacterium]
MATTPPRLVADRPTEAGPDASKPVLVYLQKGEALGDSVIHLATYRAARLAFPRHRIVNLCSHPSVYATKTMSPLAGQFLDEVHTMQPIDRGPLPLARKLAALGPIDVVIEFRSNLNALWSYLATWRVRCYVANVAGYMLRRGVGLQPLRRPVTNAARFHKMIEMAAGRSLPSDSRLPEMPTATAQAARLLPAGRRYVGLVPGPSSSIKSWPLERFVELASKVATLGLTPVMLLGLGEAAEEATLRRRLPGTILIGPSSVDKPAENLAWVIHAAAARLTACVAVEGGLGHLIATQEVPLVTLEGPTNARRWRPLTPHWWLLRARDFGSRETSAIPVHAVLNALGEISLSESTADQSLVEPSPSQLV